MATQTVVNLDIGALLIIQVNKLSSSHLKIQHQDSTRCFSAVNEHVIHPGQSLSLQLDAITNYPSAPSNMVYHLHEDLPVYLNFYLLYTLKFHFIEIINVSDKAITLPPDTLIATAYFPCQHLYLHKVSEKMLKETKLFNKIASMQIYIRLLPNILQQKLNMLTRSSALTHMYRTLLLPTLPFLKPLKDKQTLRTRKLALTLNTNSQSLQTRLPPLMTFFAQPR